MMEDMLFKTDTDYAPWTIIEATDRRFATVKIYTTVIKAMADQIEKLAPAEEKRYNRSGNGGSHECLRGGKRSR